MSYGAKTAVSGIFAVAAYIAHLAAGPDELVAWVLFMILYGIAIFFFFINAGRWNRERRAQSHPPFPPSSWKSPTPVLDKQTKAYVHYTQPKARKEGNARDASNHVTHPG